ncbi:MAG: DUF1588 domain-containing protein [Myxococcota bacterium]
MLRTLNRLALPRNLLLSLGGLATSSGCVGPLEPPSSPAQSVPAPPSSPPVDGSDTSPPAVPVGPRASSGLRALHPREYVHALEDLMGVTVSEDDLPEPTFVEGHGRIGAAQAIGLSDVEALYEVGRVAAEAWVTGLGDCALDPACGRNAAVELLDEAFRGGAPSEVHTRLLELLESAEAPEGLKTLATVAVSSPYFLYRQERGRGEAAVRDLTAPEIAARMAFLVWESGPDDTLLQSDLTDSEARGRQLDRMLQDPRARRGLRSFVLDWMGVERGALRTKDPSILENTGPELEARVAQSLTQTIDRELHEGSGSLTELLAVDRFVVDEELGELLGLGPVGSEAEGATLRPEERLGIVTHPGVLSAHTKELGASPFNIGEFVYEHLLCEPISAPPVVPEIDEGEVAGETLRERLEAATAAPACLACHDRIGPAGFAFLAFDPIGRWRPRDGLGRSFDTSGVVPVGGRNLAFNGASELLAQLARHEAVERCVARRVFRWTFGRFESPDDQALIQRLEAAAVSSGGSAEALLRAVVEDVAFTQVRREAS